MQINSENLSDFLFFYTLIACNLESNQPLSSLPDPELLLIYKGNSDQSIVGILFKRYTHLMLWVSMKYLKDEDEAKDCVMEVFEQLLTDLNRHEIKNFKSWLFTVVKNHCLMKLRKRKNKFAERIEGSETSLEVVEMSQLLHPDDAVEKEAQLKIMEKGIQSLNTDQKKCIELFYLDQKSYQEIADLTGYSMLNVKSHIQNGKRNLKIFMEKNHVR